MCLVGALTQSGLKQWVIQHVMMFVLCICVSAGIGRTGAFCSLSTAIERVKAEGMVDVFHTIKHLRTQRPHMVQNEVSTISLKQVFSFAWADYMHAEI